jgi:hypothetical protein
VVVLDDLAISLCIERREYDPEAVVKCFQAGLEATREAVITLSGATMNVVQRNANAALNLSSKLLGTKSPAEIYALQVIHAWDQLGAYLRQAEELRALAALLAVQISEAWAGPSVCELPQGDCERTSLGSC